MNNTEYDSLTDRMAKANKLKGNIASYRKAVQVAQENKKMDLGGGLMVIEEESPELFKQIVKLLTVRANELEESYDNL